MKFCIEVYENGKDKRLFFFTIDESKLGITIGRNSKNNVVLNGDMVSNFHCKVKLVDYDDQNAHIEVKDTSTNGTYVTTTETNDIEIPANNIGLNDNRKKVLGINTKLKIDRCQCDFATEDYYFLCFKFVTEEEENTIHGYNTSLIVENLDCLAYVRFDIMEKSGDGHFGCVYKAKDKDEDRIVSLKILKIGAEDYKRNGDVREEVKILEKLRNSHVLAFYEEIFIGNQVILLAEHCDGGDLFDRIKKQSMTECEVGYIFVQLLDAVDFLQKENCLHRDLKPENILLKRNTKHPEVVVADFGLAKVADFGTTRCGTVAYAAPETLFAEDNKKYTNACDIWSLGVILYIMIARYHPFSISDEKEMRRQIKEGKLSFEGSVWESKSSSVKDLIRRMIEVDPTKRITLNQIYKHEWVKNQIPKLEVC
ncbi:Protein kinase [Entamoeba marina]